MLDVAAGTSQRGLAPKGRGLSLAQCPTIGHGATTSSVVRCVRVASLIFALIRNQALCSTLHSTSFVE